MLGHAEAATGILKVCVTLCSMRCSTMQRNAKSRGPNREVTWQLF